MLIFKIEWGKAIFDLSLRPSINLLLLKEILTWKLLATNLCSCSPKLNYHIDLHINLPDHDNGEVQYVPRVSEVGGGMGHEAKSYDPHDALAGEDNSENDLNLFKKFIHSIRVTIRERGKYLKQYY